jgi:hypothetical protein|tara:strand:+ start:94 stop:243 length:150 start_codon:yes stop_codon:yes gene_type:complete
MINLDITEDLVHKKDPDYLWQSQQTLIRKVQVLERENKRLKFIVFVDNK